MLPLTTAGRIGLSVLLFLAGVVALRLGESVIVPMLVALMLATVLGPAAWWLHTTFKIRWGIACIVVVVGLVLANVLITAIFSASLTRIVAQVSSEEKVLKTYNDFRNKLEKFSPVEPDAEVFPKNPEKIADIGFFRYVAEAGPYLVREGGKYAASWTWQLVVMLFITFFVLLEGRMLARRAVAIFGPSEEVQDKATAVLFEMAKQVRIYLVWRTIINLGLALIMFLVYYFCGLSQALTWAVLLAILNYIPYFGPVLASIPPFLDAFIFSENPAVAIVVTIVFWVVVVLEGYLVVPLLMGRNMDLNATTVMLACLFWELVWGTTGLFLAMPIMAAVKAILYHVPEWRVWANLMSTAHDDAPHEHPPPADLLATPPGESTNGMLGGGHPDAVKTGDASGRSHG
ncbi:MAG: AI-2E family transporter [Planctomycetes bacterium]|nr:AI-2E family transporter [Planctomycetota bacterium]